MWGRIRLAEARGVFQREDLSKVQELALQYSVLLKSNQEMRDRQDRYMHSIKLAMAITNPALFQQFFEQQENPVTPPEATEEDIQNNAPGTWVFTAPVPEDVEAIMAQLGPAGTVNLGNEEWS